ncbi:DPT [Branchiostoma lanceolatum]|uniref:DPT protein n=1 Tax=Branchiostoma lanceolatum TaxID=7740 RepID=A0A8J9ZJH1_BRALA|nr:DPT [Branchiostoma lanceolatum]
MSPLAAVAMLLVPLAAVVATTPVQGSRVGRQLAPEPDNSSADDSAAVSGTNSSSSSTGAAAAPRPGAACNASGHGTEFGSSFTFECRESYALSAVGSRYCSATGDRAWNYSCTYMGLGQLGECYWSPFANDLGSVLWYQCPFNSLVTGFYSEYDEAQKDRRWKLKCCRSDSSVLYNCQNSLPANTPTGELHFSVFGNYFLRGVFATFKRNVRRGETDRRFQFVSCKKRSGN